MALLFLKTSAIIWPFQQTVMFEFRSFVNFKQQFKQQKW